MVAIPFSGPKLSPDSTEKPPLLSSKQLDDKFGLVARETAVIIKPSASLFEFDFFEPLPIQIEVSDVPLTSDAGLLPLRPFDERWARVSQLRGACS
jgi:hypothetical protein